MTKPTEIDIWDLWLEIEKYDHGSTADQLDFHDFLLMQDEKFDRDNLFDALEKYGRGEEEDWDEFVDFVFGPIKKVVDRPQLYVFPTAVSITPQWSIWTIPEPETKLNKIIGNLEAILEELYELQEEVS